MLKKKGVLFALFALLFSYAVSFGAFEDELRQYYSDKPLSIYNLYQTNYFLDSTYKDSIYSLSISNGDGFVATLQGALAYYERDRKKAKKLLFLAKQQANRETDVAFYSHLNISLLYLKDNRDSAQIYLDTVKQIITSQSKEEWQAFYYLIKIRLSYMDNNYNEVQSNINKIRSILPQIENQSVKLGFYNEIGILYGTMHINDESIFYFNKGLDQAKKSKDQLFLGIFLSNIGFSYTQQGDYNQAIIYFKQSLSKLKSKKMYETLSNTFWATGICYEKTNQYDSAYLYYKRSFDYALDGDLSKSFTFVHFLMKTKKEVEAHEELIKLEFASEKLSATQNEKLFGLLALSYYLKKDTSNAFKYLTKWDSVFLNLDYSSIPTMEDYQTSEMQFLNAQLKKENTSLNRANDEQKQKQNRFFIALVLVGALFLLALILIFILLQKNKQLTSNQIKIQALPSESINTGLGIDFSERMLSSLRDTKDLTKFILDFELAYPEFFPSLKTDNGKLTKNDLCFLAFDKLKLSHKEMAEILSIELPSVKKGLYRAKKKLSS